MTLLVLGLLLWVFSHTFKRILPGLRTALGEDRGKGLVAQISSPVSMLWRTLVAIQVFIPPASC